MPRRIVIYGLCDPFSGQLRYIGKTDNVRERLRQHVCDARRGRTTRTAAWIRSLLKMHKWPRAVTIERTTEDQWQEREKYWIAHFREVGCDLTNTTCGG